MGESRGSGKAKLEARPLGLAAVLGLLALAYGSGPSPAGAVQAPGPNPSPTGRLADLQIPQSDNSSEQALAARIRSLGRAFDGDVGIAVRDVQTGFTAAYDGHTFFPQQSVSKFWVAITALDAADRGALDLDQSVTLTRADLTLFHQPIARQIGSAGYSTTMNSLMFRAMTQSDNTCNDFVLRRAGGPEAVRDMFRRKGIEGIRFGPGERLMQSRLAGLQWRQEYSLGRAFYAARAQVPLATRAAAFNGYVADPVDGATPVGIVDALTRLQRGELLSPASTQRLLSIMSQTRTGPQRLTGGLAPGWRIAHKTGTGQVLGAVQTGYNDIGIVTAPDGRHYAIAVMIRRTSASIPSRMQLMQATTRTVIDYHNSRAGGGGGRIAR